MAEPLKNQFLQRPFFETLSGAIQKTYSNWDEEAFFNHVYLDPWEDLELKGRMKHASLAIGECLPSDYPTAVGILVEVSKSFSGFDGLLFSEFVLHHGIDHPELSLDALELFTRSGSAEFAIRPFIMNHEEKTMDRMLAWSKHENVHVRRLASEGCRPRLPWAPALPKFKNDPAPIFPILENLKNDPELYVRKSVANNLNDITKDHPELVLALLKKWKEQETVHSRWITRQALRSLIKSGSAEALSLVGFEPSTVEVTNFTSSKQVPFGEALDFSFELVNSTNKSQNIMVDYIIHHQKANGGLTPKVFKLKSLEIPASGTVKIQKSHVIKSITTRKYYPGEHGVSIQVNGKILIRKAFDLVIDKF